MGNLTLGCRDANLNHLKGGVKPDTVAALRTAPLHILLCSRTVSSNEQKRKLLTLKPKDSLALGVWVGTTQTSVQRKGRIKGRIPRVTDRLGKTLGKVVTRNPRGSLPVIHRDQPRASSPINYCIEMLQAGLLDGSQTSTRQTLDTYQGLNVNFHVVQAAHSAPRHSRKRDLSPGSAGCYYRTDKLKYVKSVSCVTQLSCVKPVTNVRNAALNLPVGARLLANLAGSGCRSESCSNSEGGLYPPLSKAGKSNKVCHSHKQLCQSLQEPLPAEGITSAYRQKCSGTSTKPNISGVFQPTIFGPKAQQQLETYIRYEQTESFPQGGEIQNGDTGNHQDIPPTRGVGHLNRFQRRLLPYTDTGTVQKIFEISCPGSDIPVQSSAFQSVNSTLGVHCSSKGGETDGHTRGYKNPPVPRRLVGESHIPPGLSPAYSGSSENMPRTRLAGELRKIRTGAKAGL